jgi:hypothetical protein
MAAITQSTNLTLLDRAKRLDPDGKVSAIVEILNQTNEVLDQMVWLEANDGTGHKTTTRTGLPAATWRLLNYGVQPSKSTTVQIRDTTAMLEAYAEVDKSLADLNGNTSEFRLSEDKPFLESMNQEFLKCLFQDATQDPTKFVGFGPRFNKLTGAECSQNIITGGGSAANTSIWLVVWGENTVHGIYPKGSKQGIQHNDLGEQTLFDGGSPAGRYQGYRTHYKWDCGLTVRDWRYVVRIPNIATGSLTKDAATGANLIDLMTQALETVKDVNMGTPVFYCNRTIRSFLRRQIANKVAASTLTMDEVAGRRVVTFDGIPVNRVDSITNSEATIA